MNIKVLVATHKDYKMPKDEIYLPVFVGNALHPENNPGFQGDDDGENISLKNKNYNELTAIYWAWKNLDADVIGLVHYRRYLGTARKKDFSSILDAKEIESFFNQGYDVIVPKKRDYLIESNYSHYVNSHEKEPMDELERVIRQDYPEYMDSYKYVMENHKAHMFNMFIMKKENFNRYCKWMFNILSIIEDNIDISNYNSYEKRVYGFLSELMLDIWLTKEQLHVKEVNFIYMENEHLVKKGFNLVGRKLKGAFKS
ncbi:DUF4422 domain-containing protein [Latilactobacillus curvatus]|uniref:DUF4422 domain-containing protein n=1 Tax=Latilactobacillus curvatus TaxID=28038 RepID=UPI000FECB3C7|nr:DUF4422 domain-containing protein [Latilactobacillus curvatus]QAR35027.1 DUF4422 domain-containing protein [Latilactobacillus curvatus]